MAIVDRDSLDPLRCRVCETNRGEVMQVWQVGEFTGTPRSIYDRVCPGCYVWARMVLK